MKIVFKLIIIFSLLLIFSSCEERKNSNSYPFIRQEKVCNGLIIQYYRDFDYGAYDSGTSLVYITDGSNFLKYVCKCDIMYNIIKVKCDNNNIITIYKKETDGLTKSNDKYVFNTIDSFQFSINQLIQSKVFE